MKTSPQPLRNLISQLVCHGQIKTTQARAKAIQGKIDHLVSFAQKGTLASRGKIRETLGDKKLVNKLVDEIAPRLARRQSGFTRIIKIGPRRGDGAMMTRIEFVETILIPEAENAAPVKEVSGRKTILKAGGKKNLKK